MPVASYQWISASRSEPSDKRTVAKPLRDCESIIQIRLKKLFTTKDTKNTKEIITLTEVSQFFADTYIREC
jgi:hypothetical protein